MNRSFVAELRSLLDPAGYLDGQDAASYLEDPRHAYVWADAAVVRPNTVAQVAAVVDTCARHGVKVVPQGGNTGLSGGTVVGPDHESIVLSTSRLDRIESIDPDGATMTVQAGVTIEAIQTAAAEHGLQFAPDWGARGTATIGGGISTNAGGNNVVRYGPMRSHVLGLEVVLADGTVWDGLRSLRKDVSGYDVKQLFIGAEGTLGVVTRAVLSLVPATPHTQSAFAAIDGLGRLRELTQLVRRLTGSELTAYELVPDIGVELVCKHYSVARPIATRAEYYVLLKLASTRPVQEDLLTVLDRAATQGLILDAVVAESAAHNDALWFIRDELPPERYYAHQKHAIKLDTVVPVDKIGEFIQLVQEVTDELTPGAVCYGFGHVGDGNIHMRVLPVADSAVDHFVANRSLLRRRIDEATWSLRGSLSAEHGIGIELIDRIGPQKPDIEWELMRAIKRALDPNDLMNPGKVVPMTGVPPHQ